MGAWYRQRFREDLRWIYSVMAARPSRPQALTRQAGWMRAAAFSMRGPIKACVHPAFTFWGWWESCRLDAALRRQVPTGSRKYPWSHLRPAEAGKTEGIRDSSTNRSNVPQKTLR